MLKKKRKLRINKKIKKRIILLSSLTGLLLVFAAFGVYFYIKMLQKPLYISPLSSVLSAHSTSSKDKNAQILKKGFSEKHIDFSSIIESGADYIVKLKNGSEVTFSSQKDIMSQISSLQFILSRLTMEGKLFSRLDLRFDKPVIVQNK